MPSTWPVGTESIMMFSAIDGKGCAGDNNIINIPKFYHTTTSTTT